MSNQNRFLLPTSSTSASTLALQQQQQTQQQHQQEQAASIAEQENNQHSVDTDFDSYWEEEARNPHRNRIRIGRQYQATVPALLKQGESDSRKLDELETISFCSKKSARISDAELDHYFTVAKSLNLFASLVETRSLLGRDVTIADLNRIRRKEGLSLASVIQPVRQQQQHQQNASPTQQQSAVAATNQAQLAPSSSSSSSNQSQSSPQKSPTTATSTANCDTKQSPTTNSPSSSSLLLSSSSPPKEQTLESYTFNQPLMKALSHFISLHHPCHHDRECKKLLKDLPLEDNSGPAVSITAGNLRQGTSSSSKASKPGRSRSSLKQAVAVVKEDNNEREQQADHQEHHHHHHQVSERAQSPSFEDWTREDVELFSKAIEVCGKNFSSIKKEFLPSKSVRSIVEYYYIGSRDVSDSRKKSSQSVETSDGCSFNDKSMANNNSQGGGGGSSAGGRSGGTNSTTNTTNLAGSSSSTSNSSNRATATAANITNNDPSNPSKTISDSNEETKQTSSSPNQDNISLNIKVNSTNSKQQSRPESLDSSNSANRGGAKTKNIDPRMSVYNFDEEFKEDSPIRFDCPRPGAEVKPLKAKPILPNASLDSDATNSNVGSLKFFMDGQLVLKLNACQDQQEGIDKCHWVQSGDKVVNASKQKRYTKRSERPSSDSTQNGSQSNSVVSSYQDDDSKNDGSTGDEDSKESMNSFTNTPQHPKINHGSPTPTKRLKIKNEPQNSHKQQGHLASPVDYNRLAVNNRIKEMNDNNLNPSPVLSQTAMPWLQANSFAVAAALLGGLPFPSAATGNMMANNNPPMPANVNSVNMASKPMDLSLEHHNSSPKPNQKSSSRSRSRPKNS